MSEIDNSSTCHMEYTPSRPYYGKQDKGRLFFRIESSIEGHLKRMQDSRSNQIPKPNIKINRHFLKAGTPYSAMVKVIKPKSMATTQHAFGRTLEIAKNNDIEPKTIDPETMHKDDHVTTFSDDASKNFNCECKSKKPKDSDEAYHRLRKLCEPNKMQPKPTRQNKNAFIVEATREKPSTPLPVKHTTNWNESFRNPCWMTLAKPRSPLKPPTPYKPQSPKELPSNDDFTDRQKAMIKAYQGKSHTLFVGPQRIVDKNTRENNRMMIEKLLNVESSLSKLNRYIIHIYINEIFYIIVMCNRKKLYIIFIFVFLQTRRPKVTRNTICTH